MLGQAFPRLLRAPWRDRWFFGLPDLDVLPASRLLVRSAAHKRLVAIVKGLFGIVDKVATVIVNCQPSALNAKLGLCELCAFA